MIIIETVTVVWRMEMVVIMVKMLKTMAVVVVMMILTN